ncbi:MAG: NUDIX hydrolase [Planctomycetota bacterium]|nr:NUDIX hydrolase [Planctomycetota bacterium]
MLEPAPANPWRLTARRVMYTNPWTTLIEDDILGPSGAPGLYGYFQRKDCILIAAVDDTKQLHLVRQWRWAFEHSTWELPCGTCEADEDPLAAAKRELQEETGYTAARWKALGSMCHSDARVAGCIHLFYASELSPSPPLAGDHEEQDLVAAAIPLHEAVAACHDGRIDHASSVALILRLAHLLTADLPPSPQ